MDIASANVVSTTSNMDFGCNWIDGKCASMRKREENKLIDIGLVCCRQCAHNVGFLTRNKSDLPQEYLQYWDDVKGFLNPETGCKLPSDMRSKKCLTYVCRDAQISVEDRQTLLDLEENN